MNDEQALAAAIRIADRLLFINGINKPGNEVIPCLTNVQKGSKIQAGGYCRSELIELIRSELLHDYD